ncbi:origin recognition complex [Halteromyces radiatus]|uniref:origin recognition complex n=1 Tax=Halteromyces radiatus TaxID=101107 RepID=UPI00221ED298|nr:origin recognition complex [Halteromyces radiatus]KAI8080055.1 origin recognition complex [Halteromyces radiatus]
MQSPSIASLEQRFPGRSKQIQKLVSLMGNPTDTVVPSIFVYGHSSSGKTCVVRSVLASHLPSTHYAYVHCVENYTPRMIFERALNQWCGWTPGIDNQFSNICKAESIHQFVKIIQQGVTVPTNSGKANDDRIQLGQKETIYLVLDRAERLRDMPPSILPVLLRLSEITQRNVCVLLISTIVFEKFRMKGGSYEPMYIRFPDYTKEDTLQILLLDFATVERQVQIQDDNKMTELDDDFFIKYIELIYSIFNHNCKDLNELRYFAALLFPLYLKPIQEGTVGIHETAKLFKHAQPYFAEATDKLYLREISSAEWSKETQQLDQELDENKRVGAFLSHTRSTGKGDFDLPYYTKFLLLACYLASYNPPRFDMRYFAKGPEERSKRKGGGTRKGKAEQTGGKMRQQLLGPKAFPIERMLAIFYSIIDDELEDSIDIQLQITSLTTLRLLVRCTGMDKLDAAKYKCNVSFDFIRAVAQSVRFELERYLYDFN